MSDLALTDECANGPCCITRIVLATQREEVMSGLKATHVPDTVKRTTLDGELEAWLKGRCPALGGHILIEKMRREHQALVPEKKVDMQVSTSFKLLS